MGRRVPMTSPMRPATAEDGREPVPNTGNLEAVGKNNEHVINRRWVIGSRREGRGVAWWSNDQYERGALGERTKHAPGPHLSSTATEGP